MGRTASFVRVVFAFVFLFVGLAAAADAQAKQPLRVFLRGGPKTHGPSEHEHTLWIREWTLLLEKRGAQVAGAPRFPTPAELERTDVLVMYAAEGGSIHGDERASLEKFLARGGGLVVLHDALCGDDPHWWKTVIGGAWEHGVAKWWNGDVGVYLQDFDHPITRGAANFIFEDEIYYKLHMTEDAHVLAASMHTVFDIEPQMWTVEKANYRAFVSVQGHLWKSFEHPAWRGMLLRGIAWAGKRDADLLTDAEERNSLAYPPGGPIEPKLASRKLEVDPEFRLSLVAAEPLVVKPISLDWDSKGRMWVAMTPGYPDKARFSKKPARDRIDVLEDVDGDGAMDRASTFADGLDLVTSFVFHRNGVIASASPEIWWLGDQDGDGKCDERKALFTGFGYGDTHAVVSNLRWGLDGWIYATQGYSGGASDVSSGPDFGAKRFGRIGNGLFRFKPDGSAIEMVSSYGSNTWGLDFDWDGELFFTMANGAHLRHVVLPERALAAGRLEGVETWTDVPDHDRVFPLFRAELPPYVQIDFVGGFTGASGSCVYTGGAWPEKYDGAHFVCEPTVNLVHVDFLRHEGATFRGSKEKGKEERELLAASDLWFRPVHARVGPDGALYVLDFYNQACVHNDTRGPKHGPTNAALRADRDHTHGRIWRLQHQDARKIVPPQIAGMLPADLVATLQNQNRWARMAAHRAIVDDPLFGAKEELERLLATAKSRPARLHALWALAERGVPHPEVAKDAEPALRRNALLALLEYAPDAAAPWQTALYDADRRVQLAALEAAARADGTAPYLVDLFTTLDDPWSRSAIVAAVARDTEGFLTAVLSSPKRAELTALAAAAGAAVGRAREMRELERFFSRLATTARAAESSGGLVGAALLTLGRAWKDAPDFRASTGLLTSLETLVTSPHAEDALAALPFAVRWNRDAALDAAIDAASARLAQALDDPSATLEARQRFLRLLFALPSRRADAIAASEKLFAPSVAPELRATAIEELARAGDDGSGTALVRALPTLGGRQREQALSAILSRAGSAKALLAAIDAKALTPQELGPRGIDALRQHADPTVAEAARALFERLGGATAKKIDELVAELEPTVLAPGDVVSGKKVFEANCASCHVFRGVGGKVGPDLTGMGTHGAKELLPVVLDPNRSVEAAYVEYIAVTQDERIFTGVLVRDTAASIVLRSAEGDVEVPRDELESLKSSGRSPMPAGFESLGGPALRDLFAYLGSGYEGFRTLDLRSVVNVSSRLGMYDSRYDPNPFEFVKWGVQEIGGVPFDVLDPANPSQRNVLVLKGGSGGPDWQCHQYVQKVELPLGYAVARVHVLGGIAGWGFPFHGSTKEIAKWTWKYADGQTEEVVLRDGVEFADWIGRRDVPGSKYAEGVVREDSAGQVRTFVLAPKRSVPVASIVLESFDNDLAPTWVALTAELPGANATTTTAPSATPAPRAVDELVVGGGSSHDFARWYGEVDLATLKAAGARSIRYTEATYELAGALGAAQWLALSTNQPIDADSRRALAAFVGRGGALVLLHPATWYNWADWPEYNRELVGGGARGHEAYAEFEVRIVDPAHPLAAGVAPTFRVKDELYQFERDPRGAEMHVIAVGRSLSTGKEYPVVWTVARANGRTACITLGHDGAAHQDPNYVKLLANARAWTLER
ncbi:MAG: ThuA domain-containing protein [Planctomycetes bacterium]|nr:ThuA domain-containing protein [Planctomycetota bacterium]